MAPSNVSALSERAGQACYKDCDRGCDIQSVASSRAYRVSSSSSSLNFYGTRRTFHVFAIYLVAFCLLMDLPQTSPKELQELVCKYLRYMEDCNRTLEKKSKEFSENSTYCPGGFDGFMCWPHGSPGKLVEESCPDYIEVIRATGKARRFCMGDGTWLPDTETQEPWDDRWDCNPINESVVRENHQEVDGELFMLNALQITYTIGYTLSFICLVVALVIFAYFRKLHCMRNYIHINLMISFIVRYSTVLVKDSVLKDHFDPTSINLSDITSLKVYCDDYDGVSGFMVSCRLVIVLMNYAILTNYFWLLAEGIYLQTLLLFAMTDYKDNKYFPLYMAGGWGAPWLFVGTWSILRLTLENVECWERYEISSIWWVLRAPVILSIAINLIVFVNVIRLIVSKLRAKHLNRNDYKLTLAKSTLALIPLLGIHYIVFLAITDDVVESDNPVMKIKMAFEMVLTSIQGMLISIFYCFLNGEVQGEVLKCWKNLRLKSGLPSHSYRKGSTYPSNGTQVTGLISTNSDDRSQAGQEMSLLTPGHRSERSSSNGSDRLAPPSPRFNLPRPAERSMSENVV